MFSPIFNAPQARNTASTSDAAGGGLFVYSAPAWQLQLARENRDQLAATLGVRIEPDWPVFPESLEHTLGPEIGDWGPFFGVAIDSRTLVAMGGYYGPPDSAGGVEFGYAIAAAARGRGLGLAFAEALLRRARIDPRVRQIDAHTLANGQISEEGFDNLASVAILRRLGFHHIGGDQRAWHWRLMLDTPD